MMVIWMCGMSLNDRKRSVDLYSLLGVQSVVLPQLYSGSINESKTKSSTSFTVNVRRYLSIICKAI